MMDILIVSERFAPENTVGAIRMTKIAKYMKQSMDCRITVLTRVKKNQQSALVEDLQYIDEFIYVEENELWKKLISKYYRYSNSNTYKDARRLEVTDVNENKRDFNLFNVVKIGIRTAVAVVWRECTAQAYAINAINKLKFRKFDAVITSFGPESSHYIGRKLKKKNRKITWIADFRDPLYTGEATKGFLVPWSRSFPRRVCKLADYITVVSKGFVECLGLDLNDKKVKVITNGYDYDDLPEMTVQKKNKMQFAYVGSLLTGRRDITAILEAIQCLIDEGKVDQNRVCLCYAGDDKYEMDWQLNKVGLQIEKIILGKIPKIKALEMEKSSDVLLLGAWNTKTYRGSLPLKMYEYMMMKKPIICEVSGNTQNSEIKDIIDICKVGFCYEEVCRNRDFEELKEYIYKCYCDFNNGNNSLSERDNEQIERFNYRYLASKFIDLIR